MSRGSQQRRSSYLLPPASWRREQARGHDWVGDIGRGLTTVTVKVRNPEITHIVKIQDFENWLNRGCKSPAETVLKARLRQMLSMSRK
jgi:hypothetical protein